MVAIPNEIDGHLMAEPPKQSPNNDEPVGIQPNGFQTFIMTGDAMITIDDSTARSPKSSPSQSPKSSPRLKIAFTSLNDEVFDDSRCEVTGNGHLTDSDGSLHKYHEPLGSRLSDSSLGSLDDISLDMDNPRLNPRPIDEEAACRLAKRLYNLDGFQITDVAHHLMKNNEFSQKVAEEYLAHWDFTDMNLVTAMRYFFKRFLLIGETQERERVLAQFTRRYLQCNATTVPQQYTNEDACHTLVCSLMLLNTDLHGQNVGTKMSLSDFMQNIEGLNAGTNFPAELLKMCYTSIKQKPLQWAQIEETNPSRTVALTRNADPTLAAASRDATIANRASIQSTDNPFLDVPNEQNHSEFKRGRLLKKHCKTTDGVNVGTGKRSWKSHYAVLKGMCLYLYKSESHQVEGKLQKAILLHHSLAQVARTYKKRQFVFSLTTADWSEYLLATSSAEELEDWVNTINLSTSYFSSEPLAAGVGAQKKFHRPLLPSKYSTNTVVEQCEKHDQSVRKIIAQIADEEKYTPNNDSSKNEKQFYREQMAYLEFERQRYMTYAQLLRAQLNEHPDLNMTLQSATIGESEEPSASSLSNQSSQPTNPANQLTVLSSRAPGNSCLNEFGMYINQESNTTHL